MLGGSQSYTGADDQAGTYSGFSLSNGTKTINNGDGIVLTSGLASGIVVPDNTDASFDGSLGTPGNALLSTLSGKTTFDANLLSFNFTVAAGINQVSANFVFGTDEFPDQQVPDIVGFFVDGVNYAQFSDGSLINFELGSAAAAFFNNNDVGIPNPFTHGGTPNEFQYDGLTDQLTVTGLLDSALAEHTLLIAVADTNDSIYDSAVFISGLTAGTGTGGGGITTPPSTEVIPLPASALLLLSGLAAFGGVGLRRRRAS